MLEPVVPDGCAELILHLREPYSEIRLGVLSKQPPALVAGQLTRPLHLVATGPVQVLAVRFEPHGARRFVGRPMKALTDRRCPLEQLLEIQVESLLQGLRSLPTEEARFAAVAALVERANGPAPRHEAEVAQCVRTMVKARGRIRAQDLAARCELSLWALERSFTDVVGVSPRTLASVFRVRGLFDAMQAEPSADLTQLALAADWFDHPQMARDFRRFVGCTPSAFLKQGPGLATGLATGAAGGLSKTYKPGAPQRR